MAWHHNGHWICSACLSHCARGLWAIDRLSNVEIRPCRTRRNREELVPDLALKVGSLQVQRENIVEFAPGYPLLDNIKRSLEWRILALDPGLRKSCPQVLLCSFIGLPQAYRANPLIGGSDEYAAELTLSRGESNFHALKLTLSSATLHTH